MDCSLLGSSVHGIFQARVLEWVAISFSIKLILFENFMTVCVKFTFSFTCLKLNLHLVNYVALSDTYIHRNNFSGNLEI